MLQFSLYLKKKQKHKNEGKSYELRVINAKREAPKRFCVEKHQLCNL